jgi:hypothetical protein
MRLVRLRGYSVLLCEREDSVLALPKPHQAIQPLGWGRLPVWRRRGVSARHRWHQKKAVELPVLYICAIDIEQTLRNLCAVGLETS